MIEGLAEARADGTFGAIEQECGFCVRVLLENDAADDVALEGGEAVEELLHVEDEDDAILEGFRDAVRGPTALDMFGEDSGPAANQHGCEEITAKDPFGMFAVKAYVGCGAGSRGHARIGSRGGLGLDFGMALAGGGSAEAWVLDGSAHWAPP